MRKIDFYIGALDVFSLGSTMPAVIAQNSDSATGRGFDMQNIILDISILYNRTARGIKIAILKRGYNIIIGKSRGAYHGKSAKHMLGFMVIIIGGYAAFSARTAENLIFIFAIAAEKVGLGGGIINLKRKNIQTYKILGSLH